jgi:hypothetical protein
VQLTLVKVELLYLDSLLVNPEVPMRVILFNSQFHGLAKHHDNPEVLFIRFLGDTSQFITCINQLLKSVGLCLAKFGDFSAIISSYSFQPHSLLPFFFFL